jgi:membrane protein DedA with SNARE-associated domain
VSGWLDQFLGNYGIYATFLGTAAEGEAVAVTSGVLAHEGHLAYGAVLAAAALGAFVSDVGLYGIGRRYRDSSHVRRALASPGVQRVTKVLAQNQVIYALTFRFLPGMKTAGAMTLAALGMRPVPFAVCAAISAVAWSATFVSLGYFLGNVVTRAFGDLERVEHALIAPLAAGVAFWIAVWLRRRRDRQRSEGRSAL